MTENMIEYAVIDRFDFSTPLELAAALTDMAARFPVRAVEGQAFTVNGTAYLYEGTCRDAAPYYFIILGDDANG